MPPRPAEPRAPDLRPRPELWPSPADPAAAQRFAERFAAIGPAEAQLASSPGGGPVLAALGGNSPYLSELALREPLILGAVLSEGADVVVARVLARLAQTPATSRRAVVAEALRRAKRQAALAVALADIGGAWLLDQVVAALSDLAETALRLVVDHLLLEAARLGEIRLADLARPAEGSGFVVLGMGKLGARELNYSSDIDLILIFDPAAQRPAMDGADDRADHLAASFSRVARGLVALLQERDSNGYVFRTDLRLRPDPSATPPAISLPAALIYYESMGQNWERAAMLKARPVAGDITAGAHFLEAIRPFIWRRGLDFAAIADIHAMKRRIDVHKNTGRPAGGEWLRQLAGFDLKLGRGGIREIEFLAQTLQLVWGGREPNLRVSTTEGALKALARAGHLLRGAADELAVAYRLLRRLEHRVQMVADRQTHALPERLEDLERFALFMGHTNAAELAAELGEHLDRVRMRYAEVFEAVPSNGGGLDFSGPDPSAATLDQLAGYGFAKPEAIARAIQGWQAGRVRALRSERARVLLDEVLPSLLTALARQAQPDTAFARFDSFLARLPAGVQLLSMLHRNPALVERIASVLGAAPWLADHLARVPQTLEGLLTPQRLPPAGRLLRERLRQAGAIAEAIEIVRRTVQEIDFALSVDTMECRMDADAAGLARTALADAAIAGLLPYVVADAQRRYGTVRGGGMAVVALGKAGGREMMAGSDLDLMLIYAHPDDVAESTIATGKPGRAVPVSQYYSRVAQSFIAALTSPGAGGPLYAVDMRLRPSGNAGPVAVSLGAFERYHRDHGWTWERMAITRARVVAGPRPLLRRVNAALRTVVEQANPAATLRRDAAAMRARLARDLPPAHVWDVKHRDGGQMEVEFVAQVLQLINARQHPGVADPTTRLALAKLAAAGVLDAQDAALLTKADHLWRTVQGMLRVTVGKVEDPALPPPSAAALLNAVRMDGVQDIATLRIRLDEVAYAVRGVFERLIGRPDPALLEGPN